MFGLRSKLSLGFGGLLLVILIIGIQGILRINELGQSIDVILQENYRSVIACQDMKESLDRVDSGVVFTMLGYVSEGKEQIREHTARFDKAMRVESGNITLPDEGNTFKGLEENYSKYQDMLKQVLDASKPMDMRRKQYFAELLPFFQAVKESANHILLMNQQNMADANMAARQKAAQASQRMYFLFVCGFGIAVTFIYYTGLWILRPIMALTASANEIAHGNLDLVVGTVSHDEMGQLAQAFDAMASSLRAYRRTNEAKMMNIQRSTQQALESLSAAIIVVDLDETVEVVTKAARAVFGIEVGCPLRECRNPWMEVLVRRAIQSGHREELAEGDHLIQVFIGGKERFYRPEAVPVLDSLNQPVGITLLLHDATQLEQQEELKRGLVSTVSHQLKTPLTSIRMALYLLLDDKLGTLMPKQEELLATAREDCERLYAIVEDLLDIARIQSGRAQMDLQPVDAAALAASSIETYRTKAQDCGIMLAASLPSSLPPVYADPTRISHVFGNLLTNALTYTLPGGHITVSAKVEEKTVWYAVSDTGAGIAPEYLPRVFEQFFRVPEQGSSGAGLGLAIAKEIVVAHGGEIRVESQLGEGSVFSFSLKRADDKQASATEGIRL